MCSEYPRTEPRTSPVCVLLRCCLFAVPAGTVPLHSFFPSPWSTEVERKTDPALLLEIFAGRQCRIRYYLPSNPLPAIFDSKNEGRCFTKAPSPPRQTRQVPHPARSRGKQGTSEHAGEEGRSCCSVECSAGRPKENGTATRPFRRSSRSVVSSFGAAAAMCAILRTCPACWTSQQLAGILPQDSTRGAAASVRAFVRSFSSDCRRLD